MKKISISLVDNLTRKHKLKETMLNVLLYLFLIFSIFDQSREALPLLKGINKVIPLLRDFIIIFFFIRNFSKRINVLFIFIPVLFFIAIVIGFFNTGSISVIKEFWYYIKFFLIYYVFKNETIFLNNRDKFLKFYLNTMLILFIFNLTIVFCFSSTLTMIFSAGLRLTVGNSSIVSYLYLSALIIVFYFDIIKMKYLYSIIYIIGIITTVTTTPFVALIPVILLYFLFRLNFKKKILVIALLIITIIIVFFLLSHIPSLKDFTAFAQEKGMQVIELFNTKEDIGTVGTLSTRQWQKKLLLSGMKPEDYIFGLGFYGYTKYVSMVENTFVTLIGVFGFIGLCTWSLLLALYVTKTTISLNLYNVSVFIILMCYCYTLVIFLPYATNFVTAFLLSLCNFNSSRYVKKFFLLEKDK